MTSKRRKLWTKISANGRDISVYVVARVDEEGSQAEYDYDTNSINVMEQNAHEMKQSLHHELMHVCCDSCGGELRQWALGHRTPKMRAIREERIISFLEPRQYDILVRNGFLKYPDPPRLAK